jgi:hypothetical protein
LSQIAGGATMVAKEVKCIARRAGDHRVSSTGCGVGNDQGSRGIFERKPKRPLNQPPVRQSPSLQKVLRIEPGDMLVLVMDRGPS